MKTELHVHTRYSHDSMLCCRLLGLVCRVKGIGCAAVCDHNTVSGALACKERLAPMGVSVICGEEIFTSQGEIIGLFLSETIPAGLTPEETVSRIKAQGGIVYVPHPYDEKRNKTVISADALERISAEVSAIEIHNGRAISADYDYRMQEIAHRTVPSAVMVCGSDAHTFFELGRNYMETEDYDTASPESFICAVRSGQMHTSPCHPLAHGTTKAVRLIKMLVKGDINGIFRVVRRKLGKSSK
ncbi:MAG: PHP domain-containing protein [Huintestinicola sp.]